MSSPLGMPEDEFLTTMLLLMSHRLFWTLTWNMKALFQSDGEIAPGVSTRRTILGYLREYIRLARVVPRPEHTALVSVATKMEASLSQLWPEATHGKDVYP